MTKQHSDYLLYRLLETVPGGLVWLTFVVAIGLSFIKPLWAIYFIIVFDLYWMLRVSYLMIYIVISWRRYHRAINIDWQKRLEQEYQGSNGHDWRDYWQVIFLPTYKEPYEIVAASLQAVRDTTYGDKKKMIIVLAGEERDRENYTAISERITDRFGHEFYDIVCTLHPQNLPGELAGKGSNLFHAGQEAKKRIDALSLDYKKIIVSTFDIDTIPHRQYFSHLTYQFLRHKNPYHASFQPLTFYHNNIWESDLVTRVVANSTTFWLLTDLARSERLFTFSSHSMSWQALVDIGFWQNNIVTEDSRIFLQCFIRYDGDYEVFPMYIPVSMNTVFMGNFWRSMVNQYKQMRRWAYGVEHFPYMAWHFFGNRKIPRKKKVIYLWNQTEGVYSWATAPILMFILGHLPLWTAAYGNNDSFIAQITPFILSTIMTIAMWGIILIAIMSTLMLPRRSISGGINRIWQYTLMIVQWVLFPVTMILFGSIPAVDAQTRLMLGRYLGFWVTEKKHGNGSFSTEDSRMAAQKIS